MTVVPAGRQTMLGIPGQLEAPWLLHALLHCKQSIGRIGRSPFVDVVLLRAYPLMTT